MEESKIVKYILNECSDDERKEVDSWIESSTDNRSKFQKLERTWLKSAALPRLEIDTDKAWNTFSKEHIGSTVFYMKPIYWAAASILIIVSMTIFFMGREGQTQKYAFEAIESEKDILFPDSSKAKLTNGKLSYGNPQSQKGVTVQLDGTAFFEVETQADQPFIIYTKNCSIKVLGTKFMIESQDSQTTVSVLEGKVAFSRMDEEGILLSAGMSAVYNLKNQKFIKKGVKDDFYALNKSIVFDNTDLNEVAEILSKNYHQTINVDPEIANLKINSTFKGESLETILEVLKFTLGLEVIKTKNNIILKAK
jgi:ferric-dicitrate binding protein FerR (iron transport regulator)